jgi:hypothetical protein
LANYIGGEPHLSLASDEASINALGKNTYQPLWLPVKDLATASFVTERLKNAIVQAAKDGFPQKPVTIS